VRFPRNTYPPVPLVHCVWAAVQRLAGGGGRGMTGQEGSWPVRALLCILSFLLIFIMFSFSLHSFFFSLPLLSSFLFSISPYLFLFPSFMFGWTNRVLTHLCGSSQWTHGPRIRLKDFSSRTRNRQINSYVVEWRCKIIQCVPTMSTFFQMVYCK
jgi:hypothetical protein